MKIGIVTGTRAEFGILKPLIKKIEHSKKLDLQLYVTGLHLEKAYGNTGKEVKREFRNVKSVKMYCKAKESQYHAKGLSEGISNLSKVFERDNIDIVMILGDRLEALAATLAAALQNILIAHIHGGDKTDSGHIDENIRHSISRFAHIHFVATKEHGLRLVKMGEERKRIYNVGALGIDSLIELKTISKDNLRKKLDVDFEKQVILCIFHPFMLESAKSGIYMKRIVKALKNVREQAIIIYPNNDAGSKDIIKEIKKIDDEHIKVFKNLDHDIYANLMKHSSIIIGNSSSGIIEAATFDLPVLNIGMRNVGRAYGTNVSFCDVNEKEITKSINKLLNLKKNGKKFRNIYGDGKTSDKIVEILESLKIDDSLFRKKITY